MVKPLTDAEKLAHHGFYVKPHPDGKPWSKCCSSSDPDPRAVNVLGEPVRGQEDSLVSCQCFMRKPPVGKSRYESTLLDGLSVFEGIREILKENGRFFCCHRLSEDGFHRECAGWAAKITGNK